MKALVLLFIAVSCIFAQGNTGAILGTVTDSTGAVVPGVSIVIENVRTGVRTPTETSNVGNYIVRFLPPGLYKVEAEATGFNRVVRENITLEIAREQRIDLILQPGVVTEVVTVTAETPLLETDTGQQATTLENRMVITLPLLGRNPQDLRLLAPGVAQRRDGNVVTMGGQVRVDPYFIDGVHSSAHVWSGNPTNPNPDVLEEFKVLTNSFSAEFGQSSGAIMQATTKSGTNEFHGVLFEFLRNDKLNAGNFFTHQREVLRRNEFGGTIGGPIKKNQTFFFFSLEMKRIRGNAAFTNLTVPIQPFRDGDFSSLLGVQVGTDALGRPVHSRQIFDPTTTIMVGNTPVRDPFLNNTIPADRISAAARKVQDLYPAAQSGAPFVNYNSFGSNSDSFYEMNIKIDHNFTGSDRLMIRQGRQYNEIVRPCAFPEPGGGGALGQCAQLNNPRWQTAVNHVHTFSPSIVNDLHLSFWHVFPRRTVAGFGTVSTESLGIFGLPDGQDTKGTPHIEFQNFRHLGSTSDTLFQELQNSYGLVNVTSVVRGKHSLKFGGEARKVRTDNLQPNPGNTRWRFQNIFTDQRGFGASGFDYASFLLGLPVTLQYRIFPGFFGSRGSIYALFVQDDIRLTSKLTLNLGLRWDAPLYYHEVQDRSGVFDLERGEVRQFGVDGFRRTPWEQDWVNFGPRFGFAYNIRPQTVIRGGYGLFTVGTTSSGAFGFLQPQPIFADADLGRYNTIDNVNPRTTLDLIPYEPADKTGRNALSVGVFPDNNPTSYMQQWNFNVQRQVGNVMFEAGYTGSKGTRLRFGGYNRNAIPLRLAAEAQGRFIAPHVAFPQYPGGVSEQVWIGTSAYHALQIKAERRFSAGLGFLAAYTWQKAHSWGDRGFRDPLNNRQLDRGLSENSVPHRFTIGYNYQLPWGPGRPWLSAGPLSQVLGGWELSGMTTLQAGFPLFPGLSFNSCVCGSASRPNLEGNPRLGRSERTLQRFYNVDAFSLPTLYTVGNAGTGQFFGPGMVNFNVAIAKRIDFSRLREGSNLEFRAEFFNLTNTPYFNDPNTTIGAAQAGRITAAANQRSTQMALKFYF